MALAKYLVTFHNIARDVYITVELVATDERDALEAARRILNLDQSWFFDGAEFAYTL